MATETLQTTPNFSTTRATQSTQATYATSTVSIAQVGAILLTAAGWGWIAGNFTQPTSTSWGIAADIIHMIPLALVLSFGLRYIGAGLRGIVSGGARIGLSVVAVYGLLGCAVMVVLGATNPDPNSVGVHTVADWMPVVVLNAGTLLWLATMLFRQRD